MGKILNKKEILFRVKSALQLKKDIELARFLEIAPNTLKNWYDRNSLNYDLLFSKCSHLNADWIITGQGYPFKTKQDNFEYLISSLTNENKTSELSQHCEAASLQNRIEHLESIIQVKEQIISTLHKTIKAKEEVIESKDSMIEVLKLKLSIPSRANNFEI